MRHVTAAPCRDTTEVAPPIRVDSLVTEQELSDQLADAVRAREIPEKFFYWLPLSVRAWLALCSDGEYRNFLRSRSLIARTADEIARPVGGRPLELLSLGSGQGDKDLLLLEALRRAGTDASYLALDTSQALLEIAVAGAGGAGFAARGLKADLGERAHLEAATGDATRRRMLVLIGNTLGALDPVAMARTLRALLRADDLLLVDGELYAGDETLAGYDNPINRRFAWAPLLALGIRDADGEVRFEQVADGRRPGLFSVAKHFRAARETRALLGSEEIAIARGERIAMGHSHKYTAETFGRILSDAGLAVRWDARSDDGRFVMALAGPR